MPACFSLHRHSLLQDEGRAVTARSLLPGIKVVLTSPSLSQSQSGFQHALTTLLVNMSSYENAVEEAWTIPRKRMRGACRRKRPCFTTGPVSRHGDSWRRQVARKAVLFRSTRISARKPTLKHWYWGNKIALAL